MIRNHGRHSYWIIGLAFSMCGVAWGNAPCPDRRQSATELDHAFLCESARAGNLELKMSRIAALRANSDTVRQLALTLVEEQSRARRKLEEIAAIRNLSIDDRVNRKDTQRLLVLQRRVGDEFDREYLTQLVVENRRLRDVFEQYQQKNSVPELQNFAQSRLAMLNSRLNRLQVLADSR